MLISPFLVLEPVKMLHHLREGRSMFGLVRARVVIVAKGLLGSKAKRA